MPNCGRKLSDDYYNQVFCELELGHEGQHRCDYSWDQTEQEVNEAQCELHGHIWGEWEPYKKPAPSEPSTKRDDISQLLVSQMLVNLSANSLASPKVIHPLTKIRHCTRCNKYDNDAVYDFSSGQHFYAGPFPEGAKTKWVEDRLNP